jgi:hypothetical protein
MQPRQRLAFHGTEGLFVQEIPDVLDGLLAFAVKRFHDDAPQVSKVAAANQAAKEPHLTADGHR